MCAAAIGCSACAKGEGLEKESSSFGAVAVTLAHKGQSMLVVTLTTVPSSSAETTIFIPPEPEQTICTSPGLTMGEATEAPTNSANHTSTKRAIKVALRRVCMVKRLKQFPKITYGTLERSIF